MVIQNLNIRWTKVFFPTLENCHMSGPGSPISCTISQPHSSQKNIFLTLTFLHMGKSKKKVKTQADEGPRWNDNAEDNLLINLFSSGVAKVSKKDDTKWIKINIGDKYFPSFQPRTVYHHYRKIARQNIFHTTKSGSREKGNVLHF